MKVCLTSSTEMLSPSVSYLLARPMLSGFGGGINKHTEGISMSRPPGPVTSHLLRCELSFRMPSFPLRIPFWEAETKQAEDRMTLFHSPFWAPVCGRKQDSHLVLFKVT